MKPIETRPVARIRPVGTDVARSTKNAPAQPGSAVTSATEPGVIASSLTVAAGATAPVDTNRVAEIRSALRDGTYPLMPTKVADAMIAADYFLIEARKD